MSTKTRRPFIFREVLMTAFIVLLTIGASGGIVFYVLLMFAPRVLFRVIP